MLCCPGCLNVFAARHSVVKSEEPLLFSKFENASMANGVYSGQKCQSKGKKGQLKLGKEGVKLLNYKTSMLSWCRSTA